MVDESETSMNKSELTEEAEDKKENDDQDEDAHPSKKLRNKSPEKL